MSNHPGAIANILRSRIGDGDLWLPATGASMGARFSEDTLLLVEDVGRHPRIGEIWAFVDRDGAVIAHRYLRPSRADRFVFGGDTAPRSDLPVPRDWLVGKVTTVLTGSERWQPRRIDAIAPITRAVGRTLRRRVLRRL